MTSVPLGFWPDNLSTLFTIGFLLAFFATGFDLISTELAAKCPSWRRAKRKRDLSPHGGP